MSTTADERPSIRMSQEEHGVLSKLTTAVEVLAVGQRRTEDTLAKFIDATGRQFATLAEREQFSWGKLATFLVASVTMAGAFGAVMSMYIGTALAPIQTANKVSENDREHIHEDVARLQARIDAGRAERWAAEKETAARLAVDEERANELYHQIHGHYPPPR